MSAKQFRGVGFTISPARSSRIAKENTAMPRVIIMLLGILLSVGSGAAQSQPWQPPADSQRCPSKWGAGDERGSGNHMNPASVLKAARLIRTGEVIELGRVLSESMPIPAGRHFETYTKRSRMDPGSNHRGSNE